MAEHPARRMLGERPLPSDPTTAVVTPPPPGSDYGTSGKADAVGRPRIASPTQDSLPPGPLRETRPACLARGRIRVSFSPRFALPARLETAMEPPPPGSRGPTSERAALHEPRTDSETSGERGRGAFFTRWKEEAAALHAHTLIRAVWKARKRRP